MVSNQRTLYYGNKGSQERYRRGCCCCDRDNVDVIDTVGEIANMIAGNVKTKITESYGEMELSVSIVMLGNGTEPTEKENTLISHYTKEPWTLTDFCLDDGIFKVGLLLKELA